MDPDSLEVIRRIPVGSMVRDVVADRRRALVYAGNYGDGTVDVISIALGERIGRIEVGKLVRKIGLHEQSGRVFVATYCGLIEILVDELVEREMRLFDDQGLDGPAQILYKHTTSSKIDEK